MGQVIVKGSKDTEYFPTILSKAFLHYCLYNDVSEVQFIDSFKKFLSADEAEIVQKALDAECETDPVFACDEFMDFLDQFKCRSHVTISNVKNIVSEIAQQELVQNPFLMTACWHPYFKVLSTYDDFNSPQAIEKYYDRTNPSGKKVVALLTALPTDDSDREAFSYLKTFVRGLELTQLRKLLRFFAGSDLIVINSIQVTFIKPDCDFARRPIAHTCGPTLELLSTYNSFISVCKRICKPVSTCVRNCVDTVPRSHASKSVRPQATSMTSTKNLYTVLTFSLLIF